MDAKKVYRSLVYLSLNIIKNERLRFEIVDKSDFRNQFISQINNMLTLEKDFDANLDDHQWAPTFAKAIVKITESKQRFEKVAKNIEDIYGEYSAFLSDTIKKFEIGRNELIDDVIKITEEDIIYSAMMNDDIKAKYKDLENTRQAKEEADKKAEEATKNKQDEFSNNNQNTNQNSGRQGGFFGGFGGFGGQQQQQGYGQMPLHPTQDARFYPYNAKPNWMPVVKKILAIIVILTALLLVINNIYLMTIKIKLPAEYWLKFLGLDTLPTDKAGWDAILNAWAWESFDKGQLVNNFIPLNEVGFRSIFNFLFFILPAVYIGMMAFRKPRNTREQYRISIMPVIFMIFFFVMSIFSVINLVSESNIKILLGKYNIFHAGENKQGGPVWNNTVTPHFDELWNLIIRDYGKSLNIESIFAIMSVVLISLSMVAGLTILILNPKVDRDKMMRANTEYQKVMMAMSQGQTYEMDPSLFDEPTNTKNKNPRQWKIKAWWNKKFSKDKKDKNSTQE